MAAESTYELALKAGGFLLPDLQNDFHDDIDDIYNYQSSSDNEEDEEDKSKRICSENPPFSKAREQLTRQNLQSFINALPECYPCSFGFNELTHQANKCNICPCNSKVLGWRPTSNLTYDDLALCKCNSDYMNPTGLFTHSSKKVKTIFLNISSPPI